MEEFIIIVVAFSDISSMNKKDIEKEIEAEVVKVLKHFGNSIKELREQNKISIAQLAQQCGLTQKRLTMIENGTWEDLDTITMLKLCDTLGTRIDLALGNMD